MHDYLTPDTEGDRARVQITLQDTECARTIVKGKVKIFYISFYTIIKADEE